MIEIYIIYFFWVFSPSKMKTKIKQKIIKFKLKFCALIKNIVYYYFYLSFFVCDEIRY